MASCCIAKEVPKDEGDFVGRCRRTQSDQNVRVAPIVVQDFSTRR